MHRAADEYPFPQATSADPGSVPAGHVWVTIEPSADPGLAFGLVLPEEWGAEPACGEKRREPGHLARLALFGEKRDSHGAIVQMSHMVVEFDMHLFDWMQLTAKTFSIEPLNWRVSIGPSGREIVEMLGLTGPADNRYIARTICHADAGRIVVVLAMAPLSRYAAFAETFAHITGSFTLTRPNQPGQLEPWSVAVAKSPDFRLMHPVSWAARVPQSPVAGKSAIEVILAADDDIAGYVRIKAIDPRIVADDPQRTFQLAFAELAEAGVKIESDWEDDTDPLFGGVSGFGAGKRATGRLARGPLDVRIALAEREGLHLCGTLLAPSPDEFPVQSMRAKFAFLLALASASAVSS